MFRKLFNTPATEPSTYLITHLLLCQIPSHIAFLLCTIDGVSRHIQNDILALNLILNYIFNFYLNDYRMYYLLLVGWLSWFANTKGTPLIHICIYIVWLCMTSTFIYAWVIFIIYMLISHLLMRGYMPLQRYKIRFNLDGILT